MLHARGDYQNLQELDARIPKDEPVFLLRAQDRTAAETVRHWARMNQEQGGDPALIQAALNHADAMERWPVKKAADLEHREEGEPSRSPRANPQNEAARAAAAQPRPGLTPTAPQPPVTSPTPPSTPAPPVPLATPPTTPNR